MPIITEQELIDAQVDAQALEDVVNGDASPGVVTTRLGGDLKTLARIQSESEGAVSTLAFGYLFDDPTAMADPGTGRIRLDDAVSSSVTAIAIDDTTNETGNPDISAYIATWDDSDSTNKGTFIIRKSDDPTDFAIFSITGLTENAGWTELAVTHEDSGGSFTDEDEIFVQFIRTGNKGTDGAGVGTVTQVDTEADFMAGGPITDTGTISLGTRSKTAIRMALFNILK